MRARAFSFSAWLRLSVFSGLCWVVTPGAVFAGGEDAAAKATTIESAFASTTVQISVSPGAETVPVEWKFSNHWDIPLVIEKFDQSCGCLAGILDQGAVEPGKSGVIWAAFTPGAHRGLLRKSLHVRFVGHEKPVELVLEATIPSSVELSKSELVWKVGEEMKAQTIEVTTGTDADFNITGLRGVPESQFSITEETLITQRHYRLHITPVDVSTPGVLCLQVRTNSADSRDQVLPVFLRISPPAIGTEVPAL